MAAKACQLGSRFNHCPNPPEHDCQYCGRWFCADHTHLVEDHEAVCARKQCRAKRDDLEEHLRYRERVGQRNRAGLCGIEACGPHPGYQCSLCGGFFCAPHLSDRMYPFHEGRVLIDRPVSVCARCWQRRKVWRYR